LLSALRLVWATASIRSGSSVHWFLLVVLGILVVKTTFEEAFEMVSKGVKACCSYIFELRNALDWGRISVEVAGLLALIRWEDRPEQRAVVASWAALKWCQVMYALRGFDLFGPRILPISRALLDTGSFFVVMAFNLLAFSHAYYVLGTQGGPSPAYIAVLLASRLGIVGDFDLEELEGDGSDPLSDRMSLYIHVWFALTCFFSLVLMMNLLVGILGSNYERFEEQSQSLFVRERARVITILSDRPYPWVSRVWKKNDMQDGYFYFITRVKPDATDERSTRKAIQLSTENALIPLKMQIEQNRKQIESLAAKVDQQAQAANQAKEQIEQLLKSLEGKMDQILSR
jgi:hypothetical protein